METLTIDSKKETETLNQLLQERDMDSKKETETLKQLLQERDDAIQILKNENDDLGRFEKRKKAIKRKRGER